MKHISRILIVLAALAALAAIATVPIEGSYAKRAKTYQLIEPSEEAALFGDPGTMIGTPQMYIVDDPKAVLAEPLQDGTLALDNTYLTKNGIYPLQLKTVSESLSMARLGLGVGTFVLAALSWIVSKRAKASGA